MTAEQIYQALDRADLTPPVHYCAAPHEWRDALEQIEAELEDEVFALNDEIEDLEGEVEHLKHQIQIEHSALQALELKLSDFETKDNTAKLTEMAAQAGATQ